METTLDEATLPPLLEAFYRRVRQDADLGPIFAGAVDDWPSHLMRLADFWSSVMLTTGRYKGNPMAQHIKHADSLTRPLFERWLALWQETTDAMLPAAVATTMQAKANRISESLQLALKLRTPEGIADLLGPRRKTPAPPAVGQPYRSTPVFDTASLPKGLQRAHLTKAGVWGVIRVVEGTVRYCLEDSDLTEILTPGVPGYISPQQLHRVEPVGAMRMQVDFYDHDPRPV